MWGGSKSDLNILFYESRAAGGDYSFTIDQPALMIADSYGYIKTSGTSTPNPYVSINGVMCARDRGSESQTNRYAAVSCTRILAPGFYVISVGTSYIRSSGITVIAAQ